MFMLRRLAHALQTVRRRRRFAFASMLVLSLGCSTGDARDGVGASEQRAPSARESAARAEVVDSSPRLRAGCAVESFALTEVTLAPSEFTENRDRTLAYLRKVDIESLLYNFRTTVGLPTNGARAPYGWEAPDVKLRGHATGHVLKALAQAYAGTNDAAFKDKADKLVSALAACQERAVAKGFGAGYLGAYPPDQFAALERFTTYPTIWAPYYTMHKLLAGLLAAHQLTGNTRALGMAEQLAQWAYERLRKIDGAARQRMWNLYIAGEYGGMNEVLAELYAVTGNQAYLDAARLFDKDALIGPMRRNEDRLGGLHANQHIPQVTGYLRVYEGSGEQHYLDTAQNFWSMVTRDHTYANGGTGEAEKFRPAKEIAGALTAKTAETCATYNMLKLTRQLFCHAPDVKYMDYYERALYNHILGSQDPRPSAGAAVTYFIAMQPAAQRTYDASFTCCHGTGMENHTKYQEQIYARSRDGTTLYVNLFIPSTLQWRARGLEVRQVTRYPYEPVTELQVVSGGPLKLALRVPAWAGAESRVAINGVTQPEALKPGTYAMIDRTFQAGDVVRLSLSFGLRVERAPDDAGVGAVLYGPAVLVALDAKTDMPRLSPDVKALARTFQGLEAPVSLGGSGLRFEPFWKARTTPYHTYVRFDPAATSTPAQ